MENSFVIEWSASQKSFHLHTSSEMIQRNIECLICNKKNDFLPIYTSYSRHNAEKALESFNKKVLEDGAINLSELKHVLLYLIDET